MEKKLYLALALLIGGCLQGSENIVPSPSIPHKECPAKETAQLDWHDRFRKLSRRFKDTYDQKVIPPRTS